MTIRTTSSSEDDENALRTTGNDCDLDRERVHDLNDDDDGLAVANRCK